MKARHHTTMLMKRRAWKRLARQSAWDEEDSEQEALSESAADGGESFEIVAIAEKGVALPTDAAAGGGPRSWWLWRRMRQWLFR